MKRRRNQLLVPDTLAPKTPVFTITPAYGIVCNSTGNPATNCSKQTADISAWLIDIRAGYEIGPLLVEGLYMWTSGNRAQDTLLRSSR